MVSALFYLSLNVELVCDSIFRKHLTQVSLAYQVILVMFYNDPVLNVYVFCKVYPAIARCSDCPHLLLTSWNEWSSVTL